MSRASVRSLLLALAACAAPAAARAQALAFVHEGTIYADAKEVPLKAPEGVACTDNGQVVVADGGNKRLVLFTFKDGRLGGGTEVKLAQATAPARVQIDSKGGVLVLDGKTHKIVRVAADGTFGGTVDPKGAEGAAPVPVAFKVDARDNLVLLDGPGRRAVLVDPAGTVIGQVDLPKGAGVFTDVAVDAAGNLFAVDAVAAQVWTAEKGAKEFKALSQPMKDRMSFPTYLAVFKGRLLVVDQNGSGIVVLGVDGSYQGRQLAIGWNEGLVNYPAQLCLTDSGMAFVADRFNNRVQVFITSK